VLALTIYLSFSVKSTTFMHDDFAKATCTHKNDSITSHVTKRNRMW